MEVNIPEQLTLTVSLRGSREARDGYQLFRLTGQLDAFSEPAFRRVMVRCIDEGPVHLILDLSTIDFMDSSGLGVLVQIAKKIQVNQGSLRIVTNPRVTQTVKLVRLEQFLSLVTSLEEAIEDLLAPPEPPSPAAGLVSEPEPLPDANPMQDSVPGAADVVDSSGLESTSAQILEPTSELVLEAPTLDVAINASAFAEGAVEPTPAKPSATANKAPAKRSRTKAKATELPAPPEALAQSEPAPARAPKTKTPAGAASVPSGVESLVEPEAIAPESPEKKPEAKSRRRKKAPSTPPV